MRNWIVVAGFMFGLSISMVAQTPAPEQKLSFEVASIKPNKGSGGGGWSSSGGGRRLSIRRRTF